MITVIISIIAQLLTGGKAGWPVFWSLLAFQALTS